MRRRSALVIAALTLGSSGLIAQPDLARASGATPADHGHGGDRPPTLLARATLSADFIAPGPPSGALATAANGRAGPFPGQVIPGFSGVVDNGDGTFWAMPDNGFGTKANSADFLLRLYRVRPQWETATGGAGTIEVGPFISLRDPDGLIPFPIVNGATPERLLTGADFDIESVQRGRDGTFWIGEEFGPFILHVDRTGRVLAAPYEFPDGKSPANPFLQPGETPRVRSSRGFEAMAISDDGRYLYPIVEGSFVDDPLPRRRFIYEFDTGKGVYTGRTWQYEVDTDDNVVGDAFTVRNGVLTVIERDDFEGPASVTKRLYRVDLKHPDGDGFATKEPVLDLLKIANPAGIGVASSPGAYGVSDPFAFALQSFESAIELRDGNLLVANDNNYPGSAGRRPGTPDDTEMIIIDPGRPHSTGRPDDVTVIGHRGASGYRPEHTLASYEQAILMCADFIEPDLVSTKDGVLVARHENEISGTTDVAAHPEFAALRTTKVIDGVTVTGWFTEDFTLAELRTLRAVERLPALRPANTAFNGRYRIPTLDEVLDLARHSRTCDGRPVGVYPETKHPSYFDSVGLSLEEPLVAALDHDGLRSRRSPVIIQSFETGNLRQLDTMTDVPLVQLVDCTGAPFDLRAAGDPRTYADLVTPQGLADIAQYADGVGLCKDVMIPRDATAHLMAPTTVIADAHDAGLTVHGWTFRRENQFLPADFRSSADPAGIGDLAAEINTFLDAGMDGFFSDNPDIGAATVDAR
jgi:glycerophosphoryl diester phosphodiesterase